MVHQNSVTTGLDLMLHAGLRVARLDRGSSIEPLISSADRWPHSLRVLIMHSYFGGGMPSKAVMGRLLDVCRARRVILRWGGQVDLDAGDSWSVPTPRRPLTSDMDLAVGLVHD